MMSSTATVLGRKDEQGRMTSLIEGARHGLGGALVLVGGAGIGKTALLDLAANCAPDLQVLRAGGTGDEADLPFAGLHALLEPLAGRLPQVPLEQADALAAAFTLGSSVTKDAFVVAAGAFGLIIEKSMTNPILLLVDDVHRLDTASKAVVSFIGRRLHRHSVALIATTRPEGRDDPAGGLPHHHIRALDDDTSRLVLNAASPGRLAESVREHLLTASDGVPLALVELPAALKPSERTGETPLPDPLPVGPAVCRSYEAMLDPLSHRQREALLVAAAAGALDLTRLVSAVVRLGGEESALEAAEALGVLRLSSAGATFWPNLLRAVVYQQASPAVRRRTHAALAEVTEPAERARHLAQAALRPDEQVAGEIEALVRQEARRSGPGAAALLMERAVGLSTTDEMRAQRLTLAAEFWQHAARPDRARTLLDRALESAQDPRARGRIQAVRGRQELLAGRPLAAHRLLVHEAARVRASDPARAATMLADAAHACALAGQLSSGLTLARSAQRHASGLGGLLAAVTAVELAGLQALAGQFLQSRGLLEEWTGPLDDAAGDDGVPLEYRRMAQLAHPGVLLRLGELEQAWRMVDAAVEQCRRRHQASQLPGVLALRAQVNLRLGDWDQADQDATEACLLARAAAQYADEAAALITAGRLAALRAAQDECRLNLEAARRICRDRSLRAYLVPADAAEALLDLGAGDVEDALARLEQIAGRVKGGAAPDLGAAAWAGDLVEAAARAGRTDRAREVLQMLEQQARGSITLAAIVLRCRLIVASPGELPTDESLHTAEPFEAARTDLCFGTRLLQAGEVTQGRERLLISLDVFERLGAASWAHQARAALADGGADGDHLTVQEHRVAELVAGGATNREVAGCLFVSQKTVEFHLRNVFRKLGLRSRTELANFLMGTGRLPRSLPPTSAHSTGQVLPGSPGVTSSRPGVRASQTPG